jgi:hypothetical protein
MHSDYVTLPYMFSGFHTIPMFVVNISIASQHQEGDAIRLSDSIITLLGPVLAHYGSNPLPHCKLTEHQPQNSYVIFVVSTKIHTTLDPSQLYQCVHQDGEFWMPFAECVADSASSSTILQLHQARQLSQTPQCWCSNVIYFPSSLLWANSSVCNNIRVMTPDPACFQSAGQAS